MKGGKTMDKHISGKESPCITDKKRIELLEHENKLLCTQLKVSSIIISVLTSVLTTIVLVNIVG